MFADLSLIGRTSLRLTRMIFAWNPTFLAFDKLCLQGVAGLPIWRILVYEHFDYDVGLIYEEWKLVSVIWRDELRSRYVGEAWVDVDDTCLVACSAIGAHNDGKSCQSNASILVAKLDLYTAGSNLVLTQVLVFTVGIDSRKMLLGTTISPSCSCWRPVTRHGLEKSPTNQIMCGS
jgi:hypothetical protein